MSKPLPAPISLRLDPGVKASLQAVAAAQKRSLSEVTRGALRQWLRERGHYVKAAKRRQRAT